MQTMPGAMIQSSGTACRKASDSRNRTSGAPAANTTRTAAAVAAQTRRKQRAVKSGLFLQAIRGSSALPTAWEITGEPKHERACRREQPHIGLAGDGPENENAQVRLDRFPDARDMVAQAIAEHAGQTRPGRQRRRRSAMPPQVPQAGGDHDQMTGGKRRDGDPEIAAPDERAIASTFTAARNSEKTASRPKRLSAAS